MSLLNMKILHKYGKIILGFCENVKINLTNPDRCLSPY